MRKKDGEFLNCYVDKSTNEAFSAVAKLLGKTKTAFLEEAMQSAIAPYLSYDKGGPRLNIRNAYLIEEDSSSDQESPVTKKSRCYVVSEEKVKGSLYYNIIKNGQLIKQKADMVEIIDI